MYVILSKPNFEVIMSVTDFVVHIQFIYFLDDPQTDEQEPDPALLNGDEETKTTIEEERMEEEDSTEKLETEDKIDLISIDDTTDQPDEMNSDSDSTSNDVPIIIISD